MPEYFCNGYHCEKCGKLVGVMHREVSTMAEEMLALPVKWTQQE